MPARSTPAAGVTTGNFVAEWFGHRVWPTVDGSEEAVRHQSGSLCPFLGAAQRAEVPCIKTARGMDDRTGVCTISSDSNGTRQDWLACPYRTLDQEFGLLVEAVRSCFRIPACDTVFLAPVTTLHLPQQRELLKDAVRGRHSHAFVFSGDKLGGEVDLPETNASPGSKVDVSVVQVADIDPVTGEPRRFGKHMFFEIQTADFHGSPLHAVRLLREALPRKPRKDYHADLSRQVEIAGRGVEGPNKANIFKRTIYQMILKIQLCRHELASGFVLVLPVPVWESWLRHLGRPELVVDDGGREDVVHLLAPHEDLAALVEAVPAWILVFDIDRESELSPQPLKVVHRVATSSAALVHFAFETAAEMALDAGVIERYREVLESRVREGWRGARR
ncbi:hypothetical protein L6R50_24585 [Myxococcota bacterium]|nr:hypothetical protein [Myxococcota bacterium]